MKKAIYLFIVLFLFSCARPLDRNVDTQPSSSSYSQPSSSVFTLSTYDNVSAAEHVLTFNIREGDLETYAVEIVYPRHFDYKGLLALGTSGTEIGNILVDFDFDNITDFIIPIYSLDNDNAYVDIDLDGEFDNGSDPVLVHSIVNNDHLFSITLPFGGDNDPDTVTGPFDELISIVMKEGFLVNPQTVGDYIVSAEFTSVDPDTDGADDNTGDPPLTLLFEEQVTIVSNSTPSLPPIPPPSVPADAPPSSPLLTSPANGASGLDTTVTFRWKRSKDPNGDPVNYELSYCETSDFSACASIPVASNIKSGNMLFAGAGTGIVFLGLFLISCTQGIGRKTFLVLVMTISTITIISCGSDSTTTPPTQGNISHTISGLKSGNTYYWKVSAHDGQGHSSESQIFNFTTR